MDARVLASGGRHGVIFILPFTLLRVPSSIRYEQWSTLQAVLVNS